MDPISLPLNDTRAVTETRPREGQNNVWHRVRQSDRVLVFVHGFTDNSRDCWFDAKSGSYWPDRIAGTPEFHDYSIFLGGYPTSKTAGDRFGIPDCADHLFDNLKLGLDGERAVLSRAAVFFICHSMGGIVTRYMLSAHSGAFAQTCVGLALIASPALGSGWADSLKYLADVIGNTQLASLATDNALLLDVDRRSSALVLDGPDKPIRHLFGREACETRGLYGPLPPIVAEGSAGRYFRPVTKLEATDHRSCVKPDSDNHPAHRFVRNAINDFETLYEGALRPRLPVQLVCGRLRRSVLIENENGDAVIETGILRIVAAKDGVFSPPPVRLWSGYSFEPELIWNDSGSTSPTVSLESDASGAITLRFAERPERENPANATYRYRSENAFSMHKRELRLKTGSGDGEEFVGTRIRDVQPDELVVHVRLPEQMLLIDRPYAKVTVIDSEFLDDGETARTRRFLDYSPLLRTASWTVTNPMPNRSYRICWRLQDVKDKPAHLTDAERLRHNAFVYRLSWLRGLIARANRTEAEQRAVTEFEKALAECQAFIAGRLGDAQAATGMECGLMVVDDSINDRAALLKTVASINVHRSDEPLMVGDGNAGRAVKKQSIRIYDQEHAREGYRPFSGRVPHCWLASIPLIEDRAVFAVFNLGTLSTAHVPAFRRIEPELPSIGELVHQVVIRVIADVGPA